MIILSPWIDEILAGRKAWELRPRGCRVREEIALLNCGMILGTARIVDCIGPLSLAELARHAGKHRVPLAVLRRFMRKWNGRAYAWVLEDVRPLVPPVAYAHPRGAQTWVRLPGGFTPPKRRAAA